MALSKKAELFPCPPPSRHDLLDLRGISSLLQFRAGVPKMVALTNSSFCFNSLLNILFTLNQDLPFCDSSGSPALQPGFWIWSLLLKSSWCGRRISWSYSISPQSGRGLPTDSRDPGLCLFFHQGPAEPRSCPEWWQSPCQCSRHGPDCKLGEQGISLEEGTHI